ncbi:hypothetical protein [Kistimonas scapharcae]|uniref:MBL fold metallo-hydrolase n=1 Tax=Kistimonas scapharcae TaxID=1036133 RepID=UPI0031E6B66B
MWEKIKRFFSGKDLFFLSRQIKANALTHIQNGIRPCQDSKQTDRGGFIKRGHAHLGIALPTCDNDKLYIAVDPAVNKLGPGYSPQLPPVIPEGLENTDLVLISHAHLDHFKDLPLYRLYPQMPTLFERIIQPFEQFIRRLSGHPEVNVVPTAPIRTRLCFPAGSEQIDPLFNETLENNCNDGTPVGLAADAFVPYTIKRPGSDDTIATLVAIPTKHWAGTNPLTNFHKAPGFGYLLMTEKECIFDAGDTGYSPELYDAVAAIAAKNPHPGGPNYVTALFSPAGPDFERKHMEKTHQATIDTARCITKLQLIPFIQEQIRNGITDKQQILRDFMAQTECHFIHWGHYKLGPIHFEDPWICWLKLIFDCNDVDVDVDVDLATLGEGATDLQPFMDSPEYQATQIAVKAQLRADIDQINALFDDGHQQHWDMQDIAMILMKTLLTQVATNHETSFGHEQHGSVAEWVTSDSHRIRPENLATQTLSNWFFTHPDDRSERSFRGMFERPRNPNLADRNISSTSLSRGQPVPAPDLSITVH